MRDKRSGPGVEECGARGRKWATRMGLGGRAVILDMTPKPKKITKHTNNTTPLKHSSIGVAGSGRSEKLKGGARGGKAPETPAGLGRQGRAENKFGMGQAHGGFWIGDGDGLSDAPSVTVHTANMSGKGAKKKEWAKVTDGLWAR